MLGGLQESKLFLSFLASLGMAKWGHFFREI